MPSDFYRYLAAERRFSPLTVRNYRRDLERFIAWWQEERRAPFAPEQVTADDLREWIVLRSDEGKLKAASMNRELSSLRAYFRFLRLRGRIEQSPFTHIASLRTSRRLPAFVPESRMSGILTACVTVEPTNDEEELGEAHFVKERDALIILMLYACGLRLAELIAIDRDDLAADRSTLRVHGKGDKERLVPILPYVAERITIHLDTISRQQICKNGEKALFLSCKGERISRSAVYRLVNRVLAEAGVQGKKSPHVLRHTFATHLMNGGADMREIQELMGHASLRSTQVYTHNSIARLSEVYAAAHPRERREGRAESREGRELKIKNWTVRPEGA